MAKCRAALGRGDRARHDHGREAARVSGARRDKTGIGLFLVDAKAPGVSRRGYPTMDGQRAAEVSLAGVKVGADDVIGEAGNAFPLIEQVKIQAQVLVPLVKALQAELGEERANAIARKALADLYRKYGEKWWRTQGARSVGEKMASAFEMFAAGDALQYEVVKRTRDAYDVNVTECRYARFYKEIGAPALGFLLTCSADFSHAQGFGAEVYATRTSVEQPLSNRRRE